MHNHSHFEDCMENSEKFENLFFKIFEFKEDFFYQITSNTDLLNKLLNKADGFKQIYDFFKILLKNRLIIKENIEKMKNRFIMNNQEKIFKINSIQNKLRSIKISVNGLNKKKKFYIENIQMKKADDNSLKFNLKIMNNKINLKKRDCTQIDNRINQLKLENKNLYNHELDIINQILQLEKKVGELAQDKNNKVSNISAIREEIFSLTKKIELLKYPITKITMNNEKKNFALNRKLYQIKNVNFQLTEFLIIKPQSESYNKKDIPNDNLSKSLLIKDNTIYSEIIEFYTHIYSSYKITKESIRNYISESNSKILQLENTNSKNNDRIKHLISSLKCAINLGGILNYTTCQFEDNMKDDCTGQLENLTRSHLGKRLFELMISLEKISFISTFDKSLKPNEDVEKAVKNIKEEYMNKNKFLKSENDTIALNMNSKKINLKIISKQLENKIKRKICNQFRKRILQRWKNLLKHKKKNENIISYNSYQSLNKDHYKSYNPSTDTTTESLNDNNKSYIIEFKENSEEYKSNEFMRNNLHTKSNDKEDYQSNPIFEKDKNNIFKNTKHAQFGKNKEKELSKFRQNDNKLSLTKNPYEENISNNTINFDSVLSFKTFNFQEETEKVPIKSNHITNLNQENSIVKTKKKKEKESRKEVIQKNCELNNDSNSTSISLKTYSKDNDSYGIISSYLNNQPNNHYKEKDNINLNQRTNKRSNKNNPLNSNIHSSNCNSSKNDNYKFSFKPTISEFSNNETNLTKKNVVDEHEDDLFKILQKNVREANNNKNAVGDKKKRFYENYLI